MNEVHSPKKPLIFYYMVAMLLVMLFNFIAMPWLSQYQIQEVDYNTFVSMTEKGEIGRAEIQEADNRILFTSKDEKTIYKTAMISTDSQLVQRLLDAGVSTSGEEIEQTSLLMNILSWVAPILIFIALGQFMSRKLMQKMGGGNSMMFNMGKSNAKVYVKSAEGIRFDDVAGEDEAKENLTEIVNYLHDPSKYQEIGASMPKGVLLVGPPGTGKTMLAKAVAGEANVPFFSMSGSEFVEMFVGMGASKVRDLFKQAKEKAPCIVFIDEIDAIGKKRDGQIGGNDEREQTLNQLLTEMDGFEGNTGVIILAATNRPESLDPALTRPGRFDRRVPVELPDLKGREEILKVHAKKIKVAEDVDFNKVARMASGASGAELANIVNEAALRAVRDGRKFATQADLEESIEVVIAGYQKKNAIMTDHEKRIVAYHEIGHALVAAKQTNSAPVQKITIVPRTSGALGYTMQVDEGNHVLMSKEEIENKIATFTGGRAAEEVVFGSVTTGASNDIEQATKLARALVTRYGMTEDFDMVALETVNNAYLGGDASLACSEQTAAKVDAKVVEIVQAEHRKAYKLLADNKRKLDEIAQYLYEKETISGEEFMRILNAQPQLPAGTSADSTNAVQ
ncbi:ATP-dependent zinc metalloprotease FtsH [Dysosmobacter sp.]|uniref:ATP-dependent zinc metalloprotease FtsH n=1 Tax=Dysosmobacter sp. TaxID=2591382 RepID=UPI00406DB29E